MKTMKSEFVPIDSHSGHTCALEFVPSAKRPKAVYVVFDGKRVACRGDHAEWVSMVPGYQVRDVDDGDGIVVDFDGRN
jgi:hypothetical protein